MQDLELKKEAVFNVFLRKNFFKEAENKDKIS
jgi:hypothetical protein